MRLLLGVLAGLWVTTGAAVPIGYVTLRLLRATSGGRLGPELLTRPAVLAVLLAAYALAAAIGGWAAGWVAAERKRLLAAVLAAAHVATWAVVSAAGTLTLPGWFLAALALAAVTGSVAGVEARWRQVAGRAAAVPDKAATTPDRSAPTPDRAATTPGVDP